MKTRSASITRRTTARASARPAGARRSARLVTAGLAGLVTFAGVAGGATAASAQGIGAPPTCVGKTIFASHDNQVIHGTCGDDLIKVFGYKNVTIYAHEGNDDIRGGHAGSVVNVHGGPGNDEISTSQNRLYAWGDEGNDTIKGSDKDDVLRGGSGHDDIQGGAGANFLTGDAGDDYLDTDDYGTVKPDQIFGGTGHDEARFESVDTVNADVEVKNKL